MPPVKTHRKRDQRTEEFRLIVEGDEEFVGAWSTERPPLPSTGGPLAYIERRVISASTIVETSHPRRDGQEAITP